MNPYLRAAITIVSGMSTALFIGWLRSELDDYALVAYREGLDKGAWIAREVACERWKRSHTVGFCAMDARDGDGGEPQ